MTNKKYMSRLKVCVYKIQAWKTKKKNKKKFGLFSAAILFLRIFALSCSVIPFARSHYLVGWCYFRLVLVSVTRSKCVVSSLFCLLQFQLIKVKRQLCARARAACDAVNDDRDILADFETEEMWRGDRKKEREKERNMKKKTGNKKLRQ